MIKINNEKKKNDIVNEKTNYKNGGGGGGGCHPTLSVPPLLYCNLSKKNFFFSGFCFTTIHESQDCRGIGGHLFNSSLPLPPASQAFTH